MEDVRNPKPQRRSTRIRANIPVTVTSLDRRHPLAAQSTALIVSMQGCGIRSPQALPLETPILLADLPTGGTSAGRVASCRPLGSSGRDFLIGIALYNHANVWGIINPPEDWNCPSQPAATAINKSEWPYNRFSRQGESHPGRK